MASASAGRTAERQVVAERITIGLIKKVVDELDGLQEKTGMSKSDLVNRAISLSAFINQQIDEGHDLLLRDGETGEIERIRLL